MIGGASDSGNSSEVREKPRRVGDTSGEGAKMKAIKN